MVFSKGQKKDVHHLPAPNTIPGFGFHASITSFDENQFIMISNEIPLPHNTVE